MTGPTIKSRSFSLSAALFLAVSPHLALAAATGPKLPVIQQVGVIPVQWEGGEGASYGLEPVRPTIEEGFSAAMRDAHRFHVLGDDLVAGLWNEKDGREELISQFELHSFASLTVTPRSDVVVWTARLLDPALKSQLMESDSVPRHWLTSADAEAIKERLQKLVFRLINRIPVDVSVTSVQGAFITLSGGAEQGIQVGDSVDLVRATISTLHPANGTWLDFHKRPLGKAQIIETKGYTSVARLLNLTIDNAVEVGDGARIGAIAGRQKFQRLADQEGLKDSGNQGTIVVPPLYLGTPPPVAKKPPMLAQAGPAAAPVPAMKADAPESASAGPEAPSGVTDQDPAPVTGEGSGSGSAEVKPQVAEGPKSEEPTFWDRVGSAFSGTADTVGGAVGAVVDRPFDDLRLYVGPTWWAIQGKERGLNAQGKFPYWLLNSVGGGITRGTVSKFRLAFGGGGAFGNSNAGKWYGYNGYAGIYWEDRISEDPAAVLGTWHAGGQASLSGMGVSGEGDKKAFFGGGDWVRGGFFGGLGGRIDAGESQRYDWFGDFALYPINIGRVGVEKKWQSVESTFGYGLNVGAVQYDPMPATLRFGGEFDYTNEKMTLKNGKRAALTTYAIKVLARYPLP